MPSVLGLCDFVNGEIHLLCFIINDINKKYLSVRNRSTDIMHICQIEAVHMSTSSVAHMTQKLEDSGK